MLCIKCRLEEFPVSGVHAGIYRIFVWGGGEGGDHLLGVNFDANSMLALSLEHGGGGDQIFLFGRGGIDPWHAFYNGNLQVAMETPADTFHLNHASIDVRSLQEELELLTSDLTEANEQRAQAAEYGLVLLQEKQALQSKHEELSGLYDCTKRGLDNCQCEGRRRGRCSETARWTNLSTWGRGHQGDGQLQGDGEQEVGLGLSAPGRIWTTLSIWGGGGVL